MAKVTKKTLVDHLEKLEAEDLRQEIIGLYGRFEPVKEFYQVELSGIENAVLESYKKKIHKAYFPKRGKGRRKNSTSRKLISDFKKISVFDADLAELLLYRVECAVECANTTIQKREPFYLPVIACFSEALRLMQNGGFSSHYLNRCQAVIDNAVNDFFPFKRKLAQVMEEYKIKDS